jgi:hypothetical protein
MEACQPVVEVAVWISPMGMRTTSLMGYGQAQCQPGFLSWSGPVPIGRPNSSTMAS